MNSNSKYRYPQMTGLMLCGLLLLAGCGTPETGESGDNEGFEAVGVGGSDTQEVAGEGAGRSSIEMPLEEVTLASIRLAANHVSRRAGSDSAPDWDLGSTRLGPTVRTFFRPDVEGVAYYEFAVISNGEPAGYIFISSGQHDFPVAGWDASGSTVSDSLLSEADGDVTRLYKFDSLFYVAEGEGEEMLAWSGQMPYRIQGQQMAWLDTPQISIQSHRALGVEADTEDPENAEDSEYEYEYLVQGSDEDLFQLEGWESWPDLKNGFAESSAVLLEGLRRDAAEDWQVVGLYDEYGYPLPMGTIMPISLIFDETEVLLEGVDPYALAEIPPGGAPRLDLSALTEGQFEVVLTHPTGEEERLTFFVFELPEQIVPESEAASVEVVTEMNAQITAVDPASGNATFWAEGMTEDVRNYWQWITPTSVGECWTGCGPTAWALLFGWVDYQASEGNPRWQHRWGIYREDGGYGADAVAPANMDAGIQNIILEMRSDLETFCFAPFSKAAATYPAKMGRARFYLEDRTLAGINVTRDDGGIHRANLREIIAEQIIRYDTPAIPGTGILNHYPMAYGYQFDWYYHPDTGTRVWNREFRVIQGWGNDEDNFAWVPARTFFAGEIYPNN